MVIFRLITSGLLPVLLSVLFYSMEKKTKFGECPYKRRQAIIGVGFGILAILSTEFGIPAEGVMMNVRDAAPLTAGLIFGAPAGIIAGLLGGAERWLAVYWGVGEFSRLACTLGTILAGFIGASVRLFLLDNKRPSWLYGLTVGITTEVLHMMLVFLTKMNADINQAFYVVKACTFPMVLANALSVTAATLIISIIGKEKSLDYDKPENIKITQTFQIWLMVCVLVAFSLTSVFTYEMQTQVSYANTDEMLRTNVQDVIEDISYSSDRNLLELVGNVAAEITKLEDITNEELIEIGRRYDLQEINIVNKKGVIIQSSDPALISFDMKASPITAEFMALLKGEKTYVQDLRENAYEGKEGSWKFAGVSLSDERFLQVGCMASRFQRDIDEQVVIVAKNRHIGKSGQVIICNEKGVIVSDGGMKGESISLLGYTGQVFEEGTRFKVTINGEPSYCMYGKSEGYSIISVLPVKEAMFTRDVAVYLLLFIEILIFAALFAQIVFLVKKIVVDNIRKINACLAQITGGNLDVRVNVRTNQEFASLSDDINSTVVALKHYIDEAAARIDKELEFAKRIQHSALPSVFPAYPNRKDFSIFASMDTAKEVGGDFYDFYLLDGNKLCILIADVSGKGIPAAMFMMTVKTMIKGLAENGMEVDDVLTTANNKICENNDAGMFVTVWMGILDLETGMLSYANAGHNHPAIRHKDGMFEFLKVKPNFILAGMEGIKYRKNEYQLQPGDELFLYTDGVTEAQNEEKELFGDTRLLECLNREIGLTVEEICSRVKEEVTAFAGEADQFDDITMLCVKLNEKAEVTTLQLKPTKESVPEVMSFLEGELEKMEVPRKIFTKLMIVLDEIYSNILRYSGAKMAEVQCSREGDILTLVFKDDGVPYNPLEAKEPDITLSAADREIGGLGIFMVRKLMDTADYMYKDGKNILSLTRNLKENDKVNH